MQDAPKLAKSLFYVDFVVSSYIFALKCFHKKILKAVSVHTQEKKQVTHKMCPNLKVPSVAVVSIVNNNLNFSIWVWDAVIVVYILSSSSYLQTLFNQAQQSVQQQKQEIILAVTK